MISIAIVEDDETYKKDLIKNLEKYSDEKNIKFKLFEFSDGEDILEAYEGIYELILMDIEMKFLDGMSTAKKIREIDSEVAIMFITNAPQYAINGYMVDALDYVLKPISYFNFSKRLDRALGKLKKEDEKFVMVNIDSGVKKINIKTIDFVEVQNHDLIFETDEGTFKTRGTLNDFEKTLVEYNFFRCHRCYLINVEKIDIFKGSNVITDKKNVVPVSRSKKKELMNKLNDFLNEE